MIHDFDNYEISFFVYYEDEAEVDEWCRERGECFNGDGSLSGAFGWKDYIRESLP